MQGPGDEEAATTLDCADVERNDLRQQPAIGFNRQNPDSDGQIEAPRTAGTGIEIENICVLLDMRTVGVAVQHGRKLCRGRVEPESRTVMQQIEIVALKEEDICLRKPAARTAPVIVAANGMYGCNLCKVCKDTGLAHIAEVQDMIHVGQGGRYFRAQEPVGIADDPEFHLLKLSI